MKPQIVRTDGGEELVILRRQDYDLLLARLGDEEAGLRLLDRKAAEISRRIESGEEELLPDWLSAAIMRNENVFRASRLRAGKSVGEVAAAAAVPEARVLEFEAGAKPADEDELARLSRALDADLTWFPTAQGAHFASSVEGNSSGK